MSQISRSLIVPFSTKQMFDLVNDIEKYPLFLPWCPKTEVLESSPSLKKATMHIAKGGFRKSFTTLNKLTPDERIEMRLVQGPFKALEGVWSFESLVEQSRVTLHLSFEFNSRLLSLTLGPIFQQIANGMVYTFSSRAHALYRSAQPALILPEGL